MKSKMPPGTNLVVDNHMDGAVCGVVREIGQVEGLVDHTLAGKCSITMEKYAHRPLSLGNGKEKASSTIQPHTHCKLEFLARKKNVLLVMWCPDKCSFLSKLFPQDLCYGQEW